MFKLDPQLQKQLDSLNSTYRLVYRKTGVGNNSFPTAILIDKTTKQTWARAEGKTEPDAVAEALKLAVKTDRPRSTTQIISDLNEENAKLKRQLEDAKSSFVTSSTPTTVFVDGEKPKTIGRKPKTTDE